MSRQASAVEGQVFHYRSASTALGLDTPLRATRPAAPLTSSWCRFAPTCSRHGRCPSGATMRNFVL